MTDFINFLSTILEFCCIYFMVHSFLKKGFRPSSIDITACVFIITLLNLIPQDNSAALWVLGQLSYLFYVTAVSSRNIFNSLLLYSLTTCLLLSAEFVMVIILYFIPDSFPVADSILGNTGSFLLLFLLFHFTPVSGLYHTLLHAAKLFQLLLVNTYLIFFFLLFWFKSSQLQVYNNILLFAVFVALLIILNIAVLYYDMKLQKQEQILLSYRKNIPIYESLIDDIRSSQHEYANRIQALSLLPVTCKDYETLCTALKEHTREYSHPLHAYSLLQTNMPLLSASLYNLMNRAAKNEITVHFDVVSSQLKSHAPEYILADLSCILLQNAIEECVPDDYIYVFMETRGEQFYFEVRNPSRRSYTRQELLHFFDKGVSSKPASANHGLGLFYLKSMIDKYDGTVGCECVSFDETFWTVFKFQI